MDKQSKPNTSQPKENDFDVAYSMMVAKAFGFQPSKSTQELYDKFKDQVDQKRNIKKS